MSDSSPGYRNTSARTSKDHALLSRNSVLSSYLTTRPSYPQTKVPKGFTSDLLAISVMFSCLTHPELMKRTGRESY